MNYTKVNFFLQRYIVFQHNRLYFTSFFTASILPFINTCYFIRTKICFTSEPSIAVCTGSGPCSTTASLANVSVLAMDIQGSHGHKTMGCRRLPEDFPNVLVYFE